MQPSTGRKQMKPKTKDQTEGRFHEVKGKLKQRAGQVINNRDLESKVKAENLAGKVQKKASLKSKQGGSVQSRCGFVISSPLLWCLIACKEKDAPTTDVNSHSVGHRVEATAGSRTQSAGGGQGV
jgi:uncharacterized protein YjbJ (UPF0337 family)